MSIGAEVVFFGVQGGLVVEKTGLLENSLRCVSLIFCQCWARMFWSKFNVCMSVLARLKLPTQLIRFGSSTRLSQMLLR